MLLIEEKQMFLSVRRPGDHRASPSHSSPARDRAQAQDSGLRWPASPVHSHSVNAFRRTGCASRRVPAPLGVWCGCNASSPPCTVCAGIEDCSLFLTRL